VSTAGVPKKKRIIGIPRNVAIRYSNLATALNVSVTVLDDQVVGEPVSLQCNTTTVSSMHSEVDIVWMVNNVMIANDDDRRTVNITAHGNSCTSTLHFSYLTEDDNGIYTCVVKVSGAKSETVSQSLELENFKSKFFIYHREKCMLINLTCISVFISMHACVCVCVCVCVCARVCVCMHACVCMYAYMYVCIIRSQNSLTMDSYLKQAALLYTFDIIVFSS